MLRWSVVDFRIRPQRLFLKPAADLIALAPCLLRRRKRNSLTSILASTICCSHFVSPLLSSLTRPQREQVTLYVDALLEWNQRMNLTSVTERNDVMKRHVEDSLAIIPVIRNDYAKYCSANSSRCRLIDVGTGAGLPGIILAIACPAYAKFLHTHLDAGYPLVNLTTMQYYTGFSKRPAYDDYNYRGIWNVDWEITLLESLGKRCHFLEHVMKHSHLSNVQVVCGRAETVGQSVDFREKFDVAVARAVAELRILAEYSLPLVRVGGLFVAAKGHNPQIEVENAEKAFRLLGSSILHLHSVQSEGPFGLRTAVSCLKHRPTPRKYPRLPGVPTKLPL